MSKVDDFARSMELIYQYYSGFAFDYLEANQDDLISINQAQMYAGRDAEGGPIRPKYSEDPYFESPVEAWIYSLWKMDITPHPERDIDTPNLFVNGNWYYKHITVNRFTPELMVFDNKHFIGKEIYSKYPKSLGIEPDNMAEINQDQILPIMLQEIRKALI